MSSSVDHVMSVLNLFEEQPDIGVREMSRKLGISKSTIQRIAAKLTQGHFLDKDPYSRRYRLGLRLLELGMLAQMRFDLVSAAEPILRALMRSTGETVHLAILEDLNVVYMAKVESTNSIRMRSRLGRFNPAYCTGVGKVLLADQPAETIERVIRRGLRRYTPGTIVDPATLRQHLEVIHHQGFAFDEQEIQVGLRCVASPVRSLCGDVIAAVSVAGPSQRLTSQVMRALVGPVTEAACRISEELAARPPNASEQLRPDRGPQNSGTSGALPRLAKV